MGCDVFGVAYASVNNVQAVTTAQSKKTLSIKQAKGSETDSDGNTEGFTVDNIRYKRYNGKGKIGNIRLYTGREYDSELKLYYNRARYYSPDLGRFISRDPIDISDDINLYAYVGNNGVMFVDRSGLGKDLIIVNNILEKFYLYASVQLAGLGINIQGLIDDDLVYGALHYNLATEGIINSITYSKNSEYVDLFKGTITYDSILNNITSQYYSTGNQIITGSSHSFDNFSLYSIGKFNYQATIKNNNDNILDIDIQITDVYNFNLNINADNIFDQAINMLYFSQNEGYIKEYDIIININQKIKGK